MMQCGSRNGPCLGSQTKRTCLAGVLVGIARLAFSEEGAIQLRAVYGGVSASTRSGSIVAELSGRPLQDSMLSTGAGDITVLIPSNLAVTVEAMSAYPGKRRIVSDFAEIRPRVGSDGMQSEAAGAINGGGPVLRLAASGGTIYLRREK